MPAPAVALAPTADTPQAHEAARLQRQWEQALASAEKDRSDFFKDGKAVVERYRNEATRGRTRRKGMPILYGNTEQLHSALYQKPAKPDVRRRFSDRDQVGQQAAEMIERALSYFDDTSDVDGVVSAAVQDLLLPGSGVVRIEYEPVIGQHQQVDPITGQPLFVTDDDGVPTDDPAMVDFLADQKIHHHYVFWQDMLVSPARRWADVTWVAFRHVMGREQIEKQIYANAGPDATLNGSAESIPLDWMPDGSDRSDKSKVDDSVRRAAIWEIWDKSTMNRLWIVKSAPWPLRVDPDPYELDGFFPLPEPLSAYRTNDTIVPQALFKAYEDQADDLDELSRRISTLTKALKRRGIYDQSIPELKRLANANDNEFIASPNYKNLTAAGGIALAMQTEDIRPIAAVLIQLMQQRDAQIQAIYEISGISDILRGSTDPNETLGAQQLKAQNGSLRLRRMQGMVQRFIRDLYRIKVDLMCRHFEPQVLGQITSMQVTPEIMQVIQSDMMRGCVVDIETDSTMFTDAAQVQQGRAQILQGITQLWQAWAPIVAQRPQLAGLLFKLTEFGIAPAHDARTVQDAIDEAQQAMEQAQQAPQQPPADPAAIANAQAAQAKAQAAQSKAQSDGVKAQTAVQVAQIQAQGVATKAQADVQRTALQVQNDRESHAQDMANAQAQHDQAVQHAAQSHAMDMQRQALASQAPLMPRGPQ